jgi:hypothetical protein
MYFFSPPLPWYLILSVSVYPIFQLPQPVFLFVRVQVLHPCTTTDKIIFLCILSSISLNSKLENKRFCTEWYQALLEFILLLISSWIQLWFVGVSPKYLNFATLSITTHLDIVIFACILFTRDEYMLIIFSTSSASRAVLLLVTNIDFMFFHTMCMLLPDKLTSEEARS